MPLVFGCVVVMVPLVPLLKFTAPPMFRAMLPRGSVLPPVTLMPERPRLTVSPATAWVFPVPPFAVGA